ncbi:MAG: hypothetical protein AB1414_04260 [bacterium]
MENPIEKLVEQFIVACSWNSWETITQLVPEIVSEGGKRATPTLLKIAEDSLKGLPTRKMALEMIGMIQDEEVIPELQIILRNKRGVKRKTLRGIPEDSDKMDDEEYIQDEVVLTMGKIQGTSAELDELIHRDMRITRGTLSGKKITPSLTEEIGEFEEYNMIWYKIEPGDAIHRYMGGFGGPLGHAGIYIGCKKGEELEDCRNHKIIEMSPKRCVTNNLYNFCHHEDAPSDSFWGFRKHRSITRPGRKIIFERAKGMAQKQARYSFFAGYKSPEIPTFRCDGLVEWCYEQAVREGIVDDNNWMDLTPSLQACSPKFSRVIDCPFDRRCFI